MSEELNKKLEEYIKNSIDSILNKDKEKTKTEIPFRKLTDIKEEDAEEFDTILEFVVNPKTGQAGLLIRNSELESWNKKLSQVLLDNIEASLLLLRDNLK